MKPTDALDRVRMRANGRSQRDLGWKDVLSYSGILILIVPPTCMSVGMIFIVYRKRNQFRRDDAPDSDRNW
jgi:hypothetical protein